MKMVSTSSCLSKPLLKIFVVLLVFSAGRINGEEGEETFQNLIALEKFCQNSSSTPQLESAKIPFKITIPFFASGYDYAPNFPPPFSIALIIPPLLGENYLTKKKSLFRVKKSINFSREVIRNKKEEFLPSPLISKLKSNPLIIDPNLERDGEEKYDFLSKKIPLDLEKPPLEPSNPHSFKYPQEESTLIDSNFALEKSIIGPKTFLKELHTAPTTAPYVAALEKKNVDLSPQHENLHKHLFDADNYYFYFDDSFPFTLPYPLENELVFSEKLFRGFSPPEKEKCPGNCFFAESYFKSLYRVDVSKLIENGALPPPLPSLEKKGLHFAQNQKPVNLEIFFTSPSPPSFENSFLPPSFLYQNYSYRKKVFDTPPLNQQPFENSSCLYVKSFEEPQPPLYYLPSCERAIPLSSKPLISEGPVLPTELNSDVILVAFTPSFDLYCSNGAVSTPKKAQELQESAFALINPYPYTSKYENSDKNEAVPELGNQTPLVFNKTIDELTLAPNLFPSNPLSIISRPTELPHGKIDPSSMALAFDQPPYLNSLTEDKDQERLFFPSFEPTSPPLLDPKLNLEIAPQKYLHSFPIATGGEVFDLSLKHPIFPKHHQIGIASNLKIKDRFKMDGKEFIEDFVIAKNYQPSEQKEKRSFSKSLLELTLPKYASHPLPLETDQNIPLAIQNEEINYEKHPHMVMGEFNPNELPLPYVKRKEITPKLDGKSPKKLVEDIPGIESMLALVGKKTTFSNTKNILQPPSSPTSELIYLEKGGPLIQRPLWPAFYPPDIPSLEVMATSPSIKEARLEYVKKKTAPSEISPNDFELPYLVEKRTFPDKHLMTAKSAFENLPETEKMIGLTTRAAKPPNTRVIIEPHPAPARITTDLVFAQTELVGPETTMIRSQSKEIIEDYDEENRLSSEFIALANSKLVKGPSESETRIFNQSNRFTRAFLTEIPPPSHLDTVTYHNEFDTDVHYSLRDDGKGYLFAVKMKPNEKLKFASPSQHFIFVIDGSSSIQKHRFGTFKEGVGRALSYLADGDSFNIVVADSELIPFSKTATLWSKESVVKANQFLMDRSYRGFFINYDAFNLLSDVSNYFAPDKENIVVLITDGHSFNTIKEHKNDLIELTRASKGKFSVFTATASQNNNLSMLDLLSTFNNGELMYSKTNAAFSRQLAVLVKHIECFVAKNVRVNVTSINQETGIEFYPNEKSLPSIYSDRPYVIYGSIDKLKDFDLMLQGRCGDQWINIKQTISFMHAQKASQNIKKGIALQKAYVCYDYFLNDEDSFYLSEAQRILEPLRIPTATR